MTKKQEAEKQEQIAQLRKWLKPGDTVYMIIDHVARSGMSRSIRVVLMKCEGGGGGSTRYSSQSCGSNRVGV